MTVTTGRATRGKTRYGAPNHEGRIWLFMRLSGLVMFITVVFHLLYMHMVVRVENITFDNIAERWTGPAGVFWRIFDASLLYIGMAHGMNGARFSINDYVHNKFLNLMLTGLVYGIGLLLILAGSLAIVLGAGGLGRLIGI
jgi:succinate dehydrogenase / fumarate reductase membrane anchor subunit